MVNIFVFNQNILLESIIKYSYLSNKTIDKTVFITTNFLFENEKKFLGKYFNNCEFKTFADFLTDEEMAQCDIEAFISPKMDYQIYIDSIKKNKNKIVITKVLNQYEIKGKYIFCKDLGIDFEEWKKKGFKLLIGDYYYKEKINFITKIKKKISKITILKKIYRVVKKRNIKTYIPEEVMIGYYNNKKYIFIGKMDRIKYRFNIAFKSSKEECDKLNNRQYSFKEKCIYLTTWHEHEKCNIPDNKKYEVKWIQDGYLPPNYSHKDYHFKPNNVKYYCWDNLGTQLFKNQELPYELIPFRKKIYLPIPNFPKKVQNILVIASGSGDWTALKNRSDDDTMVDAIAQIAKKFPNINFIYRCHPTWIHPQNVGVNSINRVNGYFAWLELPNLRLSGNIPVMKVNNEFRYSFPRTSLEEDLKLCDFVVGEHSISMIDAALKKIPFFSINLTKRRNFFIGLNDLGFPYCSSISEIEEMINNIDSVSFKLSFLKAINNYNEMTDMEI